MDQAWLDSLSEDWVSQPRSSGSPAPSLPSLSNSISDFSTTHAKSCRIPKFNTQKQAWTAPQDNNNSPLSERSSNDHNIPLSQRASRRPSKLRGEVSNSIRGRQLSRTVSESTTHSTQFHTIQHKSVSLSPKKGSYEIPEWKRRLLQGDVIYGEQRDLFSPAGLESIFHPPPNEAPSPTKSRIRNFGEDSVVMPSSPPPYNLGRQIAKKDGEILYENKSAEQETRACQRPRAVQYNLVNESGSSFSTNNLDQSSNFQPVRIAFQASQGQDAPSNAPSSLDPLIVRKPNPGDGRTVSGQSDVRNEEFSPVYVARHNTMDGKVNYAALDLPPAELQQRLENIMEDSTLETADGVDDSSRALLGDITTETEDNARNGRFINLRRGGYSQEGSFQKRMLSPSSLPAIDESAMLPEESLQASTPKELPIIKKTRASNEYQGPQDTQILPPIPHTPHSSPRKPGEKSSGGSPLKLFDNYDTFTNQKLLRRLSQFEGDYDGKNENARSSSQESTQPEMNEAFVAVSSPQKVSQQSDMREQASRKVTSFGEGNLDSFQFSEEISYNPYESNSVDDKANLSLPVLDPSIQTRFHFQLDPSPALQDGRVTQRREKYTATTTSTTKQTIKVQRSIRPSIGSSVFADAPSSLVAEDPQTPRKRYGDSEWKRLPRSPLKDPTPKRRRTLHKTEIAHAKVTHESPAMGSLNDTHQQMQSVIGRKRKDARHEDDQQAANPKVLAMRQILRPRTPTPSQRNSLQHEHAPLREVVLNSSEQARLLQERKIAKIQAELDSKDPLKASTALGLSQQMFDESRKGSVTTQDFLDEARIIMAGIRGKARGGLASLEESESETDRIISPGDVTPVVEFEDSYQESTKEPFSRPPSREGKPIQRLPKMQDDPALLDHLRKYQEMSDMDLVIASSIKSIAMAKEAAQTAKELDRVTDETISRSSGRLLSQEHFTESDPPNIRISENPEAQRKRKYSTSSVPAAVEDQQDAEFPSQGSNASSSQSTSRSIPTGSSRGSDSRRVIAPHTVSHLIPEQLAGMVFDRERNIWYKRKIISSESGAINFLPSDETEDDPFNDIPDLSVDETQELQRLKAVAAKKREEGRVVQQQYHESRDATNPATQQNTRMVSEANTNMPNATGALSSEPSKLTNFTSSFTVPEANTRSTSWKDESKFSASPQLPVIKRQRSRSTETATQEHVVEEVEREITIHEDRIDSASPQRRRNVTISFSSPVASVIQISDYHHDCSLEQGGQDSQSDNDDQSNLSNGSVIINKRGSAKKSTTMKIHSAFRSTSRRISLSGHTFSTRPVSRIDEQDEDSFSRHEDTQRRRNISVMVTTPMPSERATSVALATPLRMHEIGTLSLTPLSEFTMHQGDESFGLDVSYVGGGQRYVLGNNARRTLSLSIKELVEKITQVEPYEPFWEHMKQLDLKDKRLTNLHKLDEFCEQLEELDASHNQVSQLHGVPRTVRHLQIAHNHLSDMAAWGHLSNLQYIDVSNNNLESLAGFRSLIHLRCLTADHNRIKSLDGISQLDGLLSLRVRGNSIESLDFGSARLQRLTDLDLKNNRLALVQNLYRLQSLSSLNLEDNDLSEFSPDCTQAQWGLKYLKLAGNNLEKIDVSQYPNLRLLYLDRNRLGTVTGLLKTKHLDSLSMREQLEGAVIDLSFLSEALEVRKLFLSGNLLISFQPQVEFLNLQYLELANCGLETLSPEFGHMVSNTRVLNLNFNALRDIKPLDGIVRLKKLHLAGNRLSRLRTTSYVLSQFPTLSLVDLRNNPLTLGFYPPLLSETRMVVHQGIEDEGPKSEPFTLGKADRGRDTKYAGRLDIETKMLRRAFEILTLSGCQRLKTLDGLSVDRTVIHSKDKVRDFMLQAGVLRENMNEVVRDGQHKEGDKEERLESEPKATEKSTLSERWQAEDSFA